MGTRSFIAALSVMLKKKERKKGKETSQALSKDLVK